MRLVLSLTVRQMHEVSRSWERDKTPAESVEGSIAEVSCDHLGVLTPRLSSRLGRPAQDRAAKGGQDDFFGTRGIKYDALNVPEG